jgi:hypothetical protein
MAGCVLPIRAADSATTLHLFAVNRSTDRPAPLDVSLPQA